MCFPQLETSCVFEYCSDTNFVPASFVQHLLQSVTAHLQENKPFGKSPGTRQGHHPCNKLCPVLSFSLRADWMTATSTIKPERISSSAPKGVKLATAMLGRTAPLIPCFGQKPFCSFRMSSQSHLAGKRLTSFFQDCYTDRLIFLLSTFSSLKGAFVRPSFLSNIAGCQC